jgi:adenylyltransferase/sulfurtransferase
MEISVREVKRKLEAGEKVKLVDVREPSEFQQCRIDGAELIPMRTVPQHVEKLAAEEAEVVVFCHHGVRSERVVEWLRENGVKNARSMAGGIDAWSRQVDPGVPRY